MEIRPYRSQVRSVPVTSADQATPDFTKGAKLQVYGNLVEGAGKVAADAYDMFDAKRKKDFELAVKGDQQNIQMAIYDVALPNIQKYLDEQSKNPAQVFFQQDRDVDEVWNYEMQKAKENAIGNIKNPRQKAEAELYFDTLKGAAAVAVEDMTVAHKNKAASYILGKDNAAQINLGIAGDEKAKDQALSNISKNLGTMVDRGIIAPEALSVEYQKAKDQIEFGRAKNQVDALDYKTGQEFINQVPVNDDIRKKLQDYFKDKWERQKNIWEQEAGAAFEQGLDMYINGTLNREWIYSQTAFELHPEVGLNKDFRKDLVALLDDNEDDNEDKDAREAANRKYRVLIDKGDNIDNVWQNILHDPDLKASDVDTLGNLISKKQGGKGTSGSGSGSSAVASASFSALYDAVSNPYMADTERLLQIAQWKADHPEEANKTDVNKLYNEVRQGHLVTHPRIVTLDKDLETKVNDLYKAGKDDQAKALDTIRHSVFHTIAVDMWYTEDAEGKKIPVPETKRQEMLNDAINRLEQAKAMSDLADPFNYHYTDDPAKIEVIGDKYDYNINFREGGYKKVKQNVFSAHLLQDIENVSEDIKEMRKSEEKALTDMGVDLNGYEYKFLYVKGKGGNMYFYNPDKDDAYFLDYNSKGKLNAYHLPPGLAGNPDVVTPPSVKEVVDTKKSLKEARKEKAKKWAAEMDELTEM